MWDVTQTRFEDVLIKKWQQMSTKAPRRVFAQTFFKELELFLEVEPLLAAVQAEDQQKEIPIAALTLLLKRRVGQSLYHQEAQNARWLSFLENTQQRLRDLMHLDWATQDRDNFMTISKNMVKDLLNTGFQVGVLPTLPQHINPKSITNQNLKNKKNQQVKT
jgi:hypothetical protein